MLAVNTVVVASTTGQAHLYYSALLTLVLKVIVLPWILHRLIDRLNIRWDVETLINIPTTMLVGIVLVIFAFNLALPISQLAGTITRSTLGIAMASVLLSFLMMITRRKAVPQVIGFLAMENGLFFAATSATYGMPMVVELGIALDVLVGTFIFGIFFFQIRETFDSLDIHHLEKLKDTNDRSCCWSSASRWSARCCWRSAGHRAVRPPELNAAMSLLTFLAAAALTVRVICDGPLIGNARAVLRRRVQRVPGRADRIRGASPRRCSAACTCASSRTAASFPPGGCGSITACTRCSPSPCCSRCSPTTSASCGWRWRPRRSPPCCW